jgi:predicted amidohydrolase
MAVVFYKSMRFLLIPIKFNNFQLVNYNSSRMSPKIALVQTHIDYANPQKNLRAGLSWIDRAHAQGCNLVLFPELWTTGYDLENRNSHCNANQEVIAVIKNECIKKNIVVGGSYISRHGNYYQNSFILVDSTGTLAPQYHKIHLIKLFDEHKYFTPGSNTQVIRFSWGKTGLSICYDLRFPEMYRSMALNDSEIFLIVAEWPLQRIEHWNTLIKARAIENQVFVAAVNCTGNTGNETFGGSSAIISPRGTILASASDCGEQMIIQEIDLTDIIESRKEMNLFQDRREDIY